MERKHSLIAFFILFLVSIIFTVYVINWSETKGKLSFPPDYDDSHSLLEGALRLETWKRGGFLEVWREFQEIRPHSYGHYYYTSLLFGLFGIKESIPYWANGFLLFGVLWSFYRILPDSIPLPARWAWVGGFLGLPICFHLVFDFRSECTMAGLLFIGANSWLRWLEQKKKDKGLLGLSIFCFAFSVAVKPVMFPYPLGILGLCSILYLLEIKITTWPSLLRKAVFLGFIWVVVILPTVPHFLFHAKAVFGYILGVAFQSDFYLLKEEHGPRWLFHWLGYSGIWHLGGFSLLFGLIVLIVAVLHIFPQSRLPLPGWSWLRSAILTVGSFGGIAINSVHQPYFGMTFQPLLLATALWALSHIFSQQKIFWLPPFLLLILGISWWPATSNLKFAMWLIGIGIFLLIWCWWKVADWRYWPGCICAGAFSLLCWKNTQIASYHNYLERTRLEAGETGVQWRREGPKLTWNFLNPFVQDYATQHAGGYPLIAFPFFGWVDANTVGWEAVRMGYPIRMLNQLSLVEGDRIKIPEMVDFVVIPTRQGPEVIQTPIQVEIPQLEEELKGSGEWGVIGEVGTGQPLIRVYRRAKNEMRR